MTACARLLLHLAPFATVAALIAGTAHAQEAPFAPPAPPSMPGFGSAGIQPHAPQAPTAEARPWAKIRDKKGDLLVPRNPFWPVEATPMPGTGRVDHVEENGQPQINTAVIDWPMAEKELKDLKIIKGTRELFIAINGGSQVVGAGESVSIIVGSNLYTWKVRDISTSDGLKVDRISVRPAQK